MQAAGFLVKIKSEDILGVDHVSVVPNPILKELKLIQKNQ